MNDSHKTASRYDSLKTKLTSVIGYLLPLLGSLPPLAAWSGLMTVPFIIYLIMMFTNATTAPIPLPDLTRLGPLLVLTLSGFGLLLLVYSVVYLWRKKSAGLVTSGPYRICRHPQYFGLIIFTLIMTYQSVWILQNTFGVGWLSADQTKILWILMLAGYAVIAGLEEMHLEKQFGEEYTEYQQKVGHVIPFIPLKYTLLESLLVILIPYVVLEILLRLPIIL